MNKKIAVIILLLTITSIITAIKLSPIREIEEYNNNLQDDVNNNETYQEFKKYITSSEELKHDTDYYINEVRPDVRKIFDKLNDETDEVLDDLFSNKPVNIDKKLSIIKQNNIKISEKIEHAIKHFKSDDYIAAFKALKKYITLQNQVIYKLADIYKTEKKLDYNTYSDMLHNTHQDMSTQEINYMNFLSGVDLYADEKK